MIALVAWTPLLLAWEATVRDPIALLYLRVEPWGEAWTYLVRAPLFGFLATGAAPTKEAAQALAAGVATGLLLGLQAI